MHITVIDIEILWGVSSHGVEQRTVNPTVVGSNPSLPATEAQ